MEGGANVTLSSDLRGASSIVGQVARLEAVRATGLLDTPTEQEFDRLTRLASRLTGAPVTFISLVDEDRDFYKSCYGFPEPLASTRQIEGTTFCHYALVSEGPLAIENALDHPIYRNVPTVRSLGVRAYLGIPLITAAGHAIGSFCAIDFAPRKWTPLDIEVMQELAASSLREIELRTALRTLDEERRRLDTLLQHIPAGVVFAAAPSGQIVLSNRRANELAGHLVSQESPSEWAGQWPDGQEVQAAEWPIRRALRGEVVLGEEIHYARPDGARIWLRVAAAPVLDGAGQVIGAVAAFFDVDHQRILAIENARLYELARQASRSKDEFFAAVTHELRTPMTAIIGWARLLKLEQGVGADALEAVDAITSSARVQAQLVDDLLDVSRISTGKLSLSLEPLPVNAAIREAVVAAAPSADSKGVRLHSALGDDGIIDADRSRFRQIVGNLLSNSVKFTPTGGLVEISSEASHGYATIRVSDTGRGIEPELLPQIFDRFRQASSGEQGGLGLGLTIVRHLVELHGGTIRAESDGLGRGATFVVSLPLKSETPPSARSGDVSSRHAAETGPPPPSRAR